MSADCINNHNSTQPRAVTGVCIIHASSCKRIGSRSIPSSVKTTGDLELNSPGLEVHIDSDHPDLELKTIQLERNPSLARDTGHLELNSFQLEVVIFQLKPRAENDSARGRPFIIRKDRGPRAEWFQLEVDTLFFPWVHQSPKAKSFKQVRPRAETVSARGRSGLFWASVSPGSIIASRPRASYTFDLELKLFQLEVDARCSGPSVCTSPGFIKAPRPRASYNFDLELKQFQLEVNAGRGPGRA
ncbi:hypothetical protein PGT21_027179 [Puccinia graminis f. sp. tritici]|uniref:Uncharacterized protein n=1 Tax=Puccinia graminis f. sp. tritici TaxID=56615 RepID=A0A5B0MTN3_PUCGR|nr:hypothetical protein PGT21_027179 [Puccinia graminis f. sp. tritici]